MQSIQQILPMHEAASERLEALLARAEEAEREGHLPIHLEEAIWEAEYRAYELAQATMRAQSVGIPRHVGTCQFCALTHATAIEYLER